MTHPLDRPIWNSLTTRQAHLAHEADGILRYNPAYAPFAASLDGTQAGFAGLASLVPEGGSIVLQQDHAIDAPNGLKLVRGAITVRMVAERADDAEIPFAFEVLTGADAPEMLALAQLTKPGPFSSRTH